MDYQGIVLGIGLILVGILCTYGAIDQLRKGEAWGSRSGKSRARRDEDPTYFWYLFIVRILLGPISILLGILALW